MNKETETNNTEKNKSVIYKRRVQMISAAAFVLLIIAATVACIPLINDLRSPEGLDKLKERLESYSGLAGVLIFTFIQALQVVIAVVPPIQILGGGLFGWFFGALLSGALVTELVYYYSSLSYVVPVLVGVLFTLLHALIQAYVLTMLTSLFYGQVSDNTPKPPKEKKRRKDKEIINKAETAQSGETAAA